MQTIKLKNMRNLPDNYTGHVVDKFTGNQHWLLNGKYHREDGPARLTNRGTKKYWYNGKLLNENKIQQLLNLGYPIKTAIKLIYFCKKQLTNRDNVV